MGFRLVQKLMTLNDLERRNGRCQVTRAEMTQDQTWLSIRMNTLVRPSCFCRKLTELLFFLQTIFLCLVAYDKLRSVNEHDDDDNDDKFTAKSFAGTYEQTRCQLGEL